MTIKINQRAQPSMSIFTAEQLEYLHLAAMEILERTGVLVFEQESLELLKKAGCDITEGNRVRIPTQLAEWAIRETPAKITLSDRNGKRCMFLENGNPYWGTGSDTPYVLDHTSGQRRATKLQDVADAARLCDFLPNMDFVMSAGLARDVPQEMADRYHFVAMLENTTKPIIFTAWNLQNLKDIVAIAEAVAGGKEALRRNPFIVCYLEPTPPLAHTKEALEKLIYCAENQIPYIYTAASIAGTTGPITLAGSTASSIARCVSGLVISQLKRVGAPVIASFHTTIFDMKTMIHAYSAPENHLGQLASRAMADYYRLATFGKSGCSDSKIFDQQAVMEADRWIFVEGLAGDNLNHDVGYLESGMTTSLELIVACDESVASTRRFLKGIDINDQTIAMDVIDAVGPTGQFVSEEHTYEYHRKELWSPILFDRLNYRQWCESGSSSFSDRVKKRLNKILAEHQPQVIAPDVKERIDEIIRLSNEREKIR